MVQGYSRRALPDFRSPIGHLAMRLAIDRAVVSHGNPARSVVADRLMNQRPAAKAILDAPKVHRTARIGSRFDRLETGKFHLRPFSFLGFTVRTHGFVQSDEQAFNQNEGCAPDI